MFLKNRKSLVTVFSFFTIASCCVVENVHADPVPSAEDDLGVFMKAKDADNSVNKVPPAPSPATNVQSSLPVRKPLTPEEEAAQVQEAVAKINPTKGNKAKGTVRFTRLKTDENSNGPTGIRIVADIEGLNPNQKHGFHIHEFGDCSAEDGSSAGAHFNPSGFLHGGPDSATRHVGDLGNLQANDKGVAHYERIDKVISFSGASSIIGKSIIVHAKEDDFSTQPSGNAGARIGCGVIESVQKKTPTATAHNPAQNPKN